MEVIQGPSKQHRVSCWEGYWFGTNLGSGREDFSCIFLRLKGVNAQVGSLDVNALGSHSRI